MPSVGLSVSGCISNSIIHSLLTCAILYIHVVGNLLHSHLTFLSLFSVWAFVLHSVDEVVASVPFMTNPSVFPVSANSFYVIAIQSHIKDAESLLLLKIWVTGCLTFSFSVFAFALLSSALIEVYPVQCLLIHFFFFFPGPPNFFLSRQNLHFPQSF